MIDRGAGPYFYLPKLESHLEARLWNDVFLFPQQRHGIPRGTVRATVLIETIQAAFEMEEILYELREHSAGLNAGRWDYIFSIIKTLRSRGEDFVLPDRAEITMTTPFMRAYTELLIATCHRRGAHAIGGMAAFVPNRRNAEATALALQRIRTEKDGTRRTDSTAPGWRTPASSPRQQRLRGRAARPRPPGRAAEGHDRLSSRDARLQSRRRAPHAGRVCSPTSQSRCAISRPGCVVRVPSPSTT